MLLQHTIQIFKNNVNNEIFTINNVILANTMMFRGQKLIQINMDKIKIKQKIYHVI